MKQITLTAENLAKSYKNRQVVKDVSLTVKTGQIVGLLGPNGAGKTTTFYMVVGLVKSDKGRILIAIYPKRRVFFES
jgi:lipopolysaccharide export system ATP-binding protein